MKRVISFSLWGTGLKYRYGMLRNIALAKRFYPGWEVWIYCDDGCADYLLNQDESLRNDSQILIFRMPEDHWCPPMMWRFLAADDPTVERFISRDADSRIMQREVDAVNAWIQEDTILHCLRDNPAHCQPVMGGMFGLMPRRPDWEMPSMERLIREFLSEPCPYRPGEYMADQQFLWSKIWPWAKASCTQHASVCRQAYPGSKPFPTKRKEWEWPRFVGEVYEVTEVDGLMFESPRERDWESVPKGE